VHIVSPVLPIDDEERARSAVCVIRVALVAFHGSCLRKSDLSPMVRRPRAVCRAIWCTATSPFDAAFRPCVRTAAVSRPFPLGEVLPSTASAEDIALCLEALALIFEPSNATCPSFTSPAGSGKRC